MIIVSDTSPISNLLKIDQLHLLKELYGRLIIPEQVYSEIVALKQFGVDVAPLQTSDWISVQAPRDRALVENLKTEIDSGEAEAIALAIELEAAF